VTTVSDGLRTIKEAAAYLGIPAKTLYALTAARKVPFTRPAGTKHIRFSQEHLDRIVADGDQPVIEPPTRLRLVAARTPKGKATGPRPPAGPSTPPPPPGPSTPSKAGVA
jgi:excisionase family DNA binding protein